MLTTKQVAAELGVSMRRVQAMILAGRLRARKDGKSYVIREKDLESVRERKPGWRKGVPRGKRKATPPLR